jgi:hypothetical protein
MPKLCQFENCNKRASYAYYYGLVERCKEHRENMKLSTSICRCGSHRPKYNYANTKPQFCNLCKKNDMINLIHKKCVVCADKIPCFNYNGEKKPQFCNICKLPDMIDVVHNKCVACKINRASYNYVGDKKELYCKTCKLKNMVNLTTPKCITCDNKQSSYNYENKKTPLYCKTCKLPDMVDIKSKICEKCKIKYPSFNYPNEPAKFCTDCKLKGMINTKKKQCVQCNDRPGRYNYNKREESNFCSGCKKIDMIDIINTKCKNEKGMCYVRGNKKYKGYCTQCFRHLFPNDPLTFQIRCKTKEIAVRDFINQNYDGFIHDQPIWTANCSCLHRRRIDLRKIINNTLLCICVDENQHKGYDDKDEEIRYNDLMSVWGGKFIFIRFNPDKYKNSKNISKNPEINTRLKCLKTYIDCFIAKINKEENTELLEIHKLYFDGYE